MNGYDEVVVHPLAEVALERRQYWLDVIDESGRKARFQVAREVAAYMEQQARRISKLEGELRAHDIPVPLSPSQNHST